MDKTEPHLRNDETSSRAARFEHSPDVVARSVRVEIGPAAFKLDTDQFDKLSRRIL